MAELSGWEWLLGAAVVVWVVARWGRGGVTTLSPRSGDEDAAEADRPRPADWKTVALPIAAVALFVLLLIMSVRG